MDLSITDQQSVARFRGRLDASVQRVYSGRSKVEKDETSGTQSSNDVKTGKKVSDIEFSGINL